MSRAVRSLPFLFLVLLAWPVRSAEDVPPEQRLAQIEKRYMDGERREAHRDADRWIKAEPKQPWPRAAAACLAFHDKKYKRCLSYAQAAIDRGPQNAEGYFWRGRCWEARGNTLEAANEYRAALKAEAAHPQAQQGLARLQGSVGEADR
jgi:predicted Zn-dependent protease